MRHAVRVWKALLFLLGARHTLKPFDVGWRKVLLWSGLGYVLPFFAGLHWEYLQHISVINYSLTWSDLSRMHPIGAAELDGEGDLGGVDAAVTLRRARRSTSK